MILAVFTFETIFPIEHRNFYYPFLVGIEAEARVHGYDLLLLTSINNTRSGRHIYQNGRNRLQLADGAILLGAENNKQEVLTLLEDRYPFVFAGRRESPNDNISYAAADYVHAAVEIVQYLFAHHHRKIAYIATTDTKESSRDRETGVRLAHQEAGSSLPPEYIWRGKPDALTGDVLLAMSRAGVTALIAEDDLFGNRILQLAAELGWHCPSDYSLAVLGDPLSMVEPAHTWTTFKIPRQAMGQEAVRLLLQMLNDEPAERNTPYRVLLPCTFVPGTTVDDAPR